MFLSDAKYPFRFLDRSSNNAINFEHAPAAQFDRSSIINWPLCLWPTSYRGAIPSRAWPTTTTRRPAANHFKALLRHMLMLGAQDSDLFLSSLGPDNKSQPRSVLQPRCASHETRSCSRPGVGRANGVRRVERPIRKPVGRTYIYGENSSAPRVCYVVCPVAGPDFDPGGEEGCFGC